MRITLSRDHVRAMITGFGKIIPRKVAMPALDHLLVQREGENTVTITATNIEETLQFRLPEALEETETPDSFLVPFGALKKLDLKKGDTVLLQPGAGTDSPTVCLAATVGGQTVHSEVASLPVKEFPETVKTVPVASYPVRELTSVYRKALTFASTDPTRHVLNGVFRHAEEHALVGTDGRRMGRLVIPDPPVDADFILPYSKVLANGVLSAETGFIGLIEENERQTLEIQSGPWRYQVRCIDGLYPHYRQVIPDADANAGRITFADADMPLVKAAVTQYAGLDNCQIYIYADSDRVMILGAAFPENGSLDHVVLPNSSYACATDEPAVRLINGSFLLDGLAAGFNVCEVISDVSPWRCSGSTEGLHVVMPLRVDQHERQAVIEFVNPDAATQTEGDETVSTHDTTEANGTGTTQQGPESRVPPHKPDLTLVTNDPVQDLIDAVTAAQEAVKEANSALHGIKGKLRAVEKHFNARQREFETTRKVIASLKEAAGF